jgi:hypothetical protein
MDLEALADGLLLAEGLTERETLLETLGLTERDTLELGLLLGLTDLLTLDEGLKLGLTDLLTLAEGLLLGDTEGDTLIDGLTEGLPIDVIPPPPGINTSTHGLLYNNLFMYKALECANIAHTKTSGTEYAHINA